MKKGGSKKSWRCLLIAVLLVVPRGPLAVADEVIGEWDYTVGNLEYKVTIVTSDGALYWNFGETRKALREVSPVGTEQRRFQELDSCCQQVVAISRGGDLSLYDEDGLIGTATRKDASPAKDAIQAGSRGSPLQTTADGKLRGSCRVGGTQFDVDAQEVGMHTKDCETIALMVAMVRARGYRCDSVNHILPFFFGGGLTLKCNGYRYTYEFEDHGGRLVMKVVD